MYVHVDLKCACMGIMGGFTFLHAASSLGIKQLLPAYLDPNLTPEDLLTGVSFASGGSGYDSLTPKIAVISLSLSLSLSLAGYGLA